MGIGSQAGVEAAEVLAKETRNFNRGR